MITGVLEHLIYLFVGKTDSPELISHYVQKLDIHENRANYANKCHFEFSIHSELFYD